MGHPVLGATVSRLRFLQHVGLNEPVPPLFLGFIHGAVGQGKQVPGRMDLPGVQVRNADGCGCIDPLPVQDDFLLSDAGQDPLGYHRAAGGGGARQENGELVAPQPGRQIGLPSARDHDVRHRLQQVVTRLVAGSVVDGLEQVHVEQDQRQGAVESLRIEEGPLQFRVELSAVGQARQMVRFGLAGEPAEDFSNSPGQGQRFGVQIPGELLFAEVVSELDPAHAVQQPSQRVRQHQDRHRRHQDHSSAGQDEKTRHSSGVAEGGPADAHAQQEEPRGDQDRDQGQKKSG